MRRTLRGGPSNTGNFAGSVWRMRHCMAPKPDRSWAVRDVWDGAKRAAAERLAFLGRMGFYAEPSDPKMPRADANLTVFAAARPWSLTRRVRPPTRAGICAHRRTWDSPLFCLAR